MSNVDPTEGTKLLLFYAANPEGLGTLTPLSPALHRPRRPSHAAPPSARPEEAVVPPPPGVRSSHCRRGKRIRPLPPRTWKTGRAAAAGTPLDAVEEGGTKCPGFYRGSSHPLISIDGLASPSESHRVLSFACSPCLAANQIS